MISAVSFADVYPKLVDLGDSASLSSSIHVCFFGAAGDYLGSVVKTGDLNGDGYDDLILPTPITNYGPSAIYYIKGRATWLNKNLSLDSSGNYNIKIVKKDGALTDFTDWGMGLDAVAGNFVGHSDSTKDLVFTDVLGSTPLLDLSNGLMITGEVYGLSGGNFWNDLSGTVSLSDVLSSKYDSNFSWRRKIVGSTPGATLSLFVSTNMSTGAIKNDILMGELLSGTMSSDANATASHAGKIYFSPNGGIANSSDTATISDIVSADANPITFSEDSYLMGYSGDIGYQDGAPFFALPAVPLSLISSLRSSMSGSSTSDQSQNIIYVRNSNGDKFGIAPPSGCYWVATPVIMDFNGDGHPDIVTTAIDLRSILTKESTAKALGNGVYVFYGPFNFGGDFRGQLDIPYDQATSFCSGYQRIFDHYMDFTNVKAADLTKSGKKKDLIAVAPASAKVVHDLFVGSGYGDFIIPTTSPTIEPIDLSKIPLSHYRSEVFVLLGGPNRAPSTEALDLTDPNNYDYKIVGSTPLSMLGLWNGIDCGDINGDGYQEIVLGEVLGLRSLFVATGVGSSTDSRNAQIISDVSKNFKNSPVFQQLKTAFAPAGTAGKIKSMGNMPSTVSGVTSLLPGLTGAVYVMKNPWALASTDTGPKFSPITIDGRSWSSTDVFSSQPLIAGDITAVPSTSHLKSMSIKWDGTEVLPANDSALVYDQPYYRYSFQLNTFNLASKTHTLTISATDFSGKTNSIEVSNVAVSQQQQVVNLVVGPQQSTGTSAASTDQSTNGIASNGIVYMSYDLTVQSPISVMILDPRGFVIARKDIASGAQGAQVGSKNAISIPLPGSTGAGPYYYMISNAGTQLARGKFVVVK